MMTIRKEAFVPRDRQYTDNAARQAAYRARHADRKPPREDRLAGLARTLHVVLAEAIEEQKCPWPSQLLGARADETLRNLIYYLDPNPDPVRYFGMEGMPRAWTDATEGSRERKVKGPHEG
jgi:hypothetical protein